MHREISHADQVLHRESNSSLVLLTALIGLLLGLDLWPIVAGWIDPAQSWLFTWRNEINSYRLYALTASVLVGARALYGSLEKLSEGRIGADLAVAIAVIAAILTREPLVAAEIVFIGLVGECLESFTFERTQRAIHRIVEVCPRRCWLLRGGQEVRVLTTELQVGDRVVVKPGGRVPVDGIVVDGRSTVDASALTGESLPLDRVPGNEVLAGSLNQFGALTIEAHRVAEHTVVGRVIELTARALKDKAPLERTADRLARYFLPIVLGLAAVTFLVALLGQWSALMRTDGAERMELLRGSVRPALAVLVVACPCALILATPAAILAALGRLAGTGVLIKGGSALERLAQVNALAFDKTGTLTEGRLELGEILCLGSVSADDVLRAAATAEQRSEHPLGRVILEASARRSIFLPEITDFQAHAGAGVSAVADGHQLVVGTRRLLEEQGIAISPESLALLDELDSNGQTALLVAQDGQILGAIGARDRVRSEAHLVLAELRRLGITEMALLTGDRLAAARAVAETLSISEMHAELLPEQKADFLTQWASEGRQSPGSPHQGADAPPSPQRRVAMIGDGINDAPGLARADVGVAIASTGVDVAAEAGDIVFMGDPLRPLPLLLRLSRETVRIIRQNIVVFAFGVNIVGIVLTAWLWPLVAPAGWRSASPLAAVIYHQIGSLAVLLNAMRLLWFERPTATKLHARVRVKIQDIDHWVSHRLDVGEGLHCLSHHWRPVLAGLSGLFLIIYSLSGMTQIGPDEIAVVRRFGRPLDNDLGPGLHWCWPWPIDDLTRVQPDRVYSVEMGFRSMPGQAAGPQALGWSSAHASAGAKRYPEEAVMITGDGNLVELQATIRYTISNPRAYLFELGDPTAVMRSAAEAVLRELVGSWSFAELLTSRRGRLQSEALTLLTARCHESGPDGLGIRLEGIAIHDLHPPQDVVEAYHEVTKAMERRDREVNNAHAQALSQERTAEAKRLEIVRQAEAAAKEKVLLATAVKDAFLTRRRARVTLSAADESSLLADALTFLEFGVNAGDVRRDYDQRRAAMIARQTAVADFRLFWDALGQALKDREKILIDAEKVPGQRQLLIFDPEVGRIPMFPPMPTSKPKHEGP
jgi:Cu+-exporting ATPase